MSEERLVLGPRGVKVLASLTGAGDSAARVALAEEAARLADRLDDIDAIICGRGVLELLHFRLRTDDGDVAEVIFDKVLGEARQQALAFRQVLTSIDALDKSSGAEPEKPKGSALDELQKRRSARGAATTG